MASGDYTGSEFGRERLRHPVPGSFFKATLWRQYRAYGRYGHIDGDIVPRGILGFPCHPYPAIGRRRRTHQGHPTGYAIIGRKDMGASAYHGLAGGAIYGPRDRILYARLIRNLEEGTLNPGVMAAIRFI